MEVTLNKSQNRFETSEQGETAELVYQLEDGVLDIVHTGVPKPMEGRGVAAALTKTALDYARANGLKVRPSCSYVADLDPTAQGI
jgi:predicted GNAT family acetyltransferase